MHTYVIVNVEVVVIFVDYQFVHSEALFLVSICFIDGRLPQVYRQIAGVSLITGQNPNRKCLKYSHKHVNISHTMCHAAITA